MPADELGPVRRELADGQRARCHRTRQDGAQRFIPGELRIERLHGADFVGIDFAVEGRDAGGLGVGLLFET